MSVWKECMIAEVACLVKDTYKPKTGDHLPYIGLEHIQEQGLRLLGIGDSDSVTSQKFQFKSNDVLFGKLRPYFRKVVKPCFTGICSTDIWVLRALEGNDQNFIFYFFANQEFVDTANSGDSGTRMPRADWHFVKDTTWKIPSLPEQRAIAGVLSSIDDKIDLLHRQNKTLEDIAEALWRKMFVEEADRLWKKGKLGDEMSITMGQSPPGNTYNEEKRGMVFFQGRAEFEFRFPQARLYCTEPKRVAKKHDTLVSVRAPVGDINMAYEDCCIGRGLAAVRHKKGYTSYTFYKIRSLKDDFDSFEQQGTVFGSIGKDDFNNIDTFMPSEKAIQCYEHIVAPIDDKIFINSIHIRTLADLRDTLLPKLMSGEVRVNI